MYHVTYLSLKYLRIGRRGLHTGTHCITTSSRGTFKKLLLSEVLIVNILSEVLQILHVGPVREREREVGRGRERECVCE